MVFCLLRYCQKNSMYAFFISIVRFEGLGSNMLKVTQNIGWKYDYDMHILYVKIFKVGAKNLELSHIAYIVIQKL